jgi:hypothetical protein
MSQAENDAMKASDETIQSPRAGTPREHSSVPERKNKLERSVSMLAKKTAQSIKGRSKDDINHLRAQNSLSDFPKPGTKLSYTVEHLTFALMLEFYFKSKSKELNFIQVVHFG